MSVVLSRFFCVLIASCQFRMSICKCPYWLWGWGRRSSLVPFAELCFLYCFYLRVSARCIWSRFPAAACVFCFLLREKKSLLGRSFAAFSSCALFSFLVWFWLLKNCFLIFFIFFVLRMVVFKQNLWARYVIGCRICFFCGSDPGRWAS